MSTIPNLAYGDDSGKQGPLLVVGAVVASVPAWEKFSKEWAEQLQLADIDVFKMTLAAKWPAEKLRPFQKVIKDNVEYAVAAAVRRDDYRRIFDGCFTDTLDKEMWAAYISLILGTLRIEMKRPGIHPIEFIFDVENKATAREVIMQWDSIRHHTSPMYGISIRARSRMGRPPLFRDDEDEAFLPLQAADMAAWYYRRKLEEDAGETKTKKLDVLFPEGFPARFCGAESTAAELGRRANYIKTRKPETPYQDARARGKRHKKFAQDEAKKK